MRTKVIGASLIAIITATGAAGAQEAPENIVTTWFGVTNNHYQIGDYSFIQDGAVSPYSGDMEQAEAVDKAWSVLEAGGATAPEFFLIGHDHGDHSEDVVVWAEKFPDAQFVGHQSLCDTFEEAGIEGRCTGLTPDTANGEHAIELNEFVTIWPIRWRHSSHSNCEWNSIEVRPDTPTFGFVMKVEAADGDLVVFSHDSGSPRMLTTTLEDEQGEWQAPTASLIAAMENAGTDTIDLWQGGSENRVLAQARYIIPAFDVKAFQPQHWADRGNVLYEGVSWEYTPGPNFPAFLEEHGVMLATQDNFFDALIVDSEGVRRHENPEVKEAAGLPASGTGPKEIVPHPKLATIPLGQCPMD